MKRIGPHGVLALAAVAITLLGLWRQGAGEPEAIPSRASSGLPTAARPIAVPSNPALVLDVAAERPAEPILSRLLSGELPPPSPDILSGPPRVEGSGAAVEEFPDLALTASQRAIVDGLLAERRIRLDAVRQEAVAAPQSRESAERLAARARDAHASCIASVRGCLLADQRAPFEAALQSGKWGRYVLVIPFGP